MGCSLVGEILKLEVEETESPTTFHGELVLDPSPPSSHTSTRELSRKALVPTKRMMRSMITASLEGKGAIDPRPPWPTAPYFG